MDCTFELWSWSKPRAMVRNTLVSCGHKPQVVSSATRGYRIYFPNIASDNTVVSHQQASLTLRLCNQACLFDVRYLSWLAIGWSTSNVFVFAANYKYKIKFVGQYATVPSSAVNFIKCQWSMYGYHEGLGNRDGHMIPNMVPLPSVFYRWR